VVVTKCYLQYPTYKSSPVSRKWRYLVCLFEQISLIITNVSEQYRQVNVTLSRYRPGVAQRVGRGNSSTLP